MSHAARPPAPCRSMGQGDGPPGAGLWIGSHLPRGRRPRMATTLNKQKLFTQLLTSQSKAAARLSAAGHDRPVLEQFVYAVCREDATREAADRAYRGLQESFYDWNEVRVSSEQEIGEVLGGLSEPETRGRRIRDFLQEVFETTFSFDLEPLQKKGVKLAAKQLSRYQAANDYAVAWVVQQSLGGHAIPLDGRSVRVLKRLGLIDEHENNAETMRASLEHQVPKAKGTQFVDIVSEVAESCCWEDDPACPACPLHTCCPVGSVHRPAPTASKKPR
jgi:endonuclease III